MITADDTVWGMRSNKSLIMEMTTRDIPLLVCDAVNLEGVEMAQSEVRMLLDGKPLDDHKPSDENMARNQAEAWNYLLSLVSSNRFVFSQNVAMTIHQIANKDESLGHGAFRTGDMSIDGIESPSPKELNKRWTSLEWEAHASGDIYDRAITVFLRMARSMFFWDVNKRMGRFMMNGILLEAGYPIISVPASKKKEFNQLILQFYESSDMTPMNQFLRQCIDPKIIENFR